MTMTKTGTMERQIMVNQDTTFKLALEPSDFETAYRAAAMAHKIQLCGVTSPEDALVRMMTGRELGLTAFQSMRLIYVVEGRPALDASLMLALCLNHPSCEYFELVESTPEKATYRAKRKGRPEIVLTWTIEQARKAKLTDRGKDPSMNNWNRYPDAMLRARCVSALARIVFPEAIAGLYTREEFDDGEVPANEMTGEIVEVVPAVVPQAPPRDYDAEAASLKEKIAAACAAKSREQLHAVRTEMKAWDAGEPWAGEVLRFYNLAVGEAKATNGAAQVREPGQEG